MKILFYILISIFMLFANCTFVFADDSTEAIKFFKKYVNAANSYSSEILKMYSPDARIIRQVIKPDGELVNIETDTKTYLKQLKIGEATAKLRQYKNTYTNITSAKVKNGYKISALRQPSGERYRLHSYMIIQKQPNGEWIIVEELMQTKVQTFLKYAKR